MTTTVTCQTCGTPNFPGGSHCGKCQQPLGNVWPSTVANVANTYADPCTMCQGHGFIYEDQGAGQTICPYCHGSKTNQWAVTNQQATAVDQKDRKLGWWLLAILLLLCCFGGPLGSWRPVAIVFAVPTLLFVIWRLRPRSSNTARARFTSQEEVNTRNLAGGALAAGLIFKQAMHHRKK